MNLINLLTSFRGRISRKQFWIGFIVVCFGDGLGALLLNPEFFTAEEPPSPNWPDTLWQLAWLVPSTAITVKRFNDRDWPVWLGYVFPVVAVPLLFLEPYIYPTINPDLVAIGVAFFWIWISAVIWLCISAAYLLFALIDNGFIRGTQGPNRYGPDPLPPPAAQP